MRPPCNIDCNLLFLTVYLLGCYVQLLHSSVIRLEHLSVHSWFYVLFRWGWHHVRWSNSIWCCNMWSCFIRFSIVLIAFSLIHGQLSYHAVQSYVTRYVILWIAMLCYRDLYNTIWCDVIPWHVRQSLACNYLVPPKWYLLPTPWPGERRDCHRQHSLNYSVPHFRVKIKDFFFVFIGFWWIASPSTLANILTIPLGGGSNGDWALEHV